MHTNDKYKFFFYRELRVDADTINGKTKYRANTRCLHKAISMQSATLSDTVNKSNKENIGFTAIWEYQ